MSTAIAGVDTVNNSSSTSGGLDAEDDNAFLKRFTEYIKGLGKGNVYGMIAGAKSVNGVRSVSIVEHFPPITGNYNASVYIDDGSGNAPQILIDAVTLVLVGDGTENYPGYKPAGINIRVLAPSKVTININVTVTETGEIGQDVLTVNIENAINNYINNLQLGEDVIRNKLIDAIMNLVGIYDIDLTTPSGNTAIAATQIARVGTITIDFYTP
jgi:uncharacterized phage protein gp47/JayE